MRNARLAHTFSHWRFHLYEWVVDYLDDHGYCTPARIVERDSYTTKKRRDCANEIVDEMDANGEVARLWRDFEAELNVASEAQVGIPTPSVRPTDS